MTAPITGEEIIRARDVTKSFALPEGKGAFTVLDHVTLAIRAGEIVAVLGKSGSGKSTLLRILAGLIPPSTGEVISSSMPVNGPNPDVAMVFQSYALLPWLTVQRNVEIGLEAVGVEQAERHARALQAIDRVGLDGFENAYPKELSGGMKQRVGIARAFVMEPKVLFMDEPFSGLDVLTAENLRGEVADLWEQGNFPARSIVLVTHNIEESVLLADRVIILGNNPGRVRGEVVVDLARPRNRKAMRFKQLVDTIYAVMTNPEVDVAAAMQRIDRPRPAQRPVIIALPSATAGGISGLLELVNERGGREDLPALASQLQLEADDLTPIMDAAALLGFATVSGGDIVLTPSGQAFAEADIQTSKDIFRHALMEHVPLMQSIVQTLRVKKDGTMRVDFFADILDEHFPEDEASRQLQTAVDWGRYGELFDYDAAGGRISLPVEQLAS
jgi:NitT/TauT family transport system ATP-binding protein